MMQETTSGSQPHSLHWPSVGQLALSLLATLALWGLALSLMVMVLSTAFSVQSINLTAQALPLLLTAAGCAFSGVLLLPSAWQALLRILGRDNPIRIKIRRPGLLILILPFVVVSGYLASQNDILTWVALPPLHVIAIGISVAWLLYLGLRGLSAGSAQRAWGLFGSGMILAPGLSLITEMAALFLLAIFGILYLSSNPVFADQLVQLSQQLALSPDLPPEKIFEVLEPYIRQPATIYIALIFGAILVPLLEELFKPIGVWFLIGKNPSATQGFAAGLLCGAGYALFENFALSASSGEEWAAVVVARMGTSMIHILTTGLTGWALARAWGEGRYLRLGLTYLTSVSIHALWNGLVILSIAPEILPEGADYPAILLNVGAAAPLGFIVLLVGGFALLLGCNAAMRRAIIPPVKLQLAIAGDETALAANSPKEETPENGNHQLSD